MIRRKPARGRLGLMSICVAVCLAAAPGHAIVVNDDPAAHEVTPPSAYDMVGYHYDAVGGSTGALVSPWFVLTAGHVVDYGTNRHFRLHLESGTVDYDWADTIRHPSADLALVRLSSNTGLPGYDLYTLAGEAGQTAIMVGYGMSGTGETVGDGGDPNYPRGIKRWGTNAIDHASYGSGAHYLAMDFDNNGADVMIALGDSGGPAFLDIGGTLKLAGIHFNVECADPEHWPGYGDIGYDIRVGSYVDWINGNIPALGDFNEDGLVSDHDIDLLFDEINGSGTNVWPYDLTADDAVTKDDVDYLVEDILGTYHGDTNLDGMVNISDLSTLANNYGATDANWAGADFNGDGLVRIQDLAILANKYGQGTGGLVLGQSVPEPASTALLAMGGLYLLLRRRRLV